MSDCWRCDQKAEYKNARMKGLREEANRRSLETGETMAIIQKSGCIYEVVEKSEVNGQQVKEYINANSS